MAVKLLVHTCCGPCATYPIPYLREQGHQIYGYFYNPNIHPFTEYQKRKEALEEYAHQEGVQLIADEEYHPEEYFRNTAYREPRRCFFCYQMRLYRAAQIARKGKFDGFTTTLLVSPFQKHDLIREVGEAAAESYEVPFVYHDFREGFQETVERSKSLGLYRQQYCGCLYSELERYRPKNKR
ncbi:MAG: epoxyqueuosine reductase QueH [Syntrophomonadaceae bacterium]|jgi:predicted adenine nucleotide alpha hydrolase (AANH) superfamily ATPase|nr:epoxyqueuosine reductase QueH [Syntrophomonadaceae bacterium]